MFPKYCQGPEDFFGCSGTSYNTASAILMKSKGNILNASDLSEKLNYKQRFIGNFSKSSDLACQDNSEKLVSTPADIKNEDDYQGVRGHANTINLDVLKGHEYEIRYNPTANNTEGNYEYI